MANWLCMLGRWLGLGAVAVMVAALPAAPPARAQEAPDPSDAVVALLRQVCEQQWIDGVCDTVLREDPAYRSEDDPAAGPLQQRIGIVHEHSGYSDGDPDSRPADYFRAAKEGHNDDGGSDTGVIVDYLLSSEHSENEKLPITTAAVCIDPSSIPDGLAELDVERVLPPLRCSNLEKADHHRKWSETLAQAIEATDLSPEGEFTGFTAMRGFEWTNDYFNHLGVYFSRNVTNAKVDGSYLTMDRFWDWLRRAPEDGGGGDALVVFNHPGGLPALSPFDGDQPHNQLLQDLKGGANWNDVAYVPDVDARVVGMEVHGGDDLSWYVRALSNGWHLGPIAGEDIHDRSWSTTEDGKTLVLTRGRSPRDYYVGFREHRTVAIGPDLVDGSPGQPAVHPKILYWAGPSRLDHPSATPLGGTVTASRATLHLDVTGLPAGSPVVLVSDTVDTPVAVGTADAGGRLSARHRADAPAEGEDWWFALVCPPGTVDCGSGEQHSAVTAPIWLRAPGGASGGLAPDGLPSAASVVASPQGSDVSRGAASEVFALGGAATRLPATGRATSGALAALLMAGGVALLVVRRRVA